MIAQFSPDQCEAVRAKVHSEVMTRAALMFPDLGDDRAQEWIAYKIHYGTMARIMRRFP